ncbi:CBO0543 family protein [Neobacillus cucumis]|uniref:CBO0543 family protein n=1 Tax=Neobacillus cucumis TaxID=1740721 RepID=UPI002E2242DC|nr:hypothetical protein [Neobacillus cucumis]
MKPPMIYQDELEKLTEMNNKAQEIKFDIWNDHVVFTAHWWITVFLTIVPWILWFFFRKKDSSSRLLFAGFFSMIVSILFDFIGTKLGFWLYYYDLMPFIPSFSPWDITLIPVLIMSLIQIKPSVNPFVKALLFSIIASFIGEPLFRHFGFYKPIKWDSLYSFPINYCIFLIAYFLSRRKSFNEV